MNIKLQAAAVLLVGYIFWVQYPKGSVLNKTYTMLSLFQMLGGSFPKMLDSVGGLNDFLEFQGFIKTQNEEIKGALYTIIIYNYILYIIYVYNIYIKYIIYIIGRGVNQSIKLHIWNCSHTGRLQGDIFWQLKRALYGVINQERLEQDICFVEI